MNKVFTLLFCLMAMFTSQSAMAYTSDYYLHATVDVADDSEGLGTVYFSDGTVEKDTMMNGVSGGFYLPVKVIPADGYVLKNFTDDNNGNYELDQSGFVYVVSFSNDESVPTIVNLHAHFMEKPQVDANAVVVEGTVSSYFEYATFVAPVDVEFGASVYAYKITAYKDGALYFEEVGSKVPANTAVLLCNYSISDAHYSFTCSKDDITSTPVTTGLLTGCYEDYFAPAGSYDLLNLSGVAFYRSENDHPADAFSCYLNPIEGAPSQLAIDVSNIATAIEALTTSKAPAPIYDINGIKQPRLQKGVNIVNGVKIVVE